MPTKHALKEKDQSGNFLEILNECVKFKEHNNKYQCILHPIILIGTVRL